MDEARPDAMGFIRQYHSKIWTGSQFLTHCKVDYVTNNFVESFNNWIKSWKGLNLDEFMDKLRILLTNKWYKRRTISRKMGGLILPHVMKNCGSNVSIWIWRCVQAQMKLQKCVSREAMGTSVW
jgi:hypothetical protein